MKKMTAIAALSLVAILPFASIPASAETANAQTDLCVEAPVKAANSGIDCTATSAIGRYEEAASKKYPSGPVNYGGGIVF
ncbi:MAG: hypothetical protein ACSHXI_12745 [Hoeflea sp.]|uniref:hypothetical protein n=1 Tax=Hoeflea sp. TaxID=1940281 RepID=UPI003EF9287C